MRRPATIFDQHGFSNSPAGSIDGVRHRSRFRAGREASATSTTRYALELRGGCEKTRNQSTKLAHVAWEARLLWNPVVCCCVSMWSN